MKPAPATIGRSRIICYTPIDHRHQHTAGSRHIVAGELMAAFAGLAIAQFPETNGFYLLYCDQDWQEITDGYHSSIEEAKAQAEFEYTGSTATWITNT